MDTFLLLAQSKNSFFLSSPIQKVSIIRMVRGVTFTRHLSLWDGIWTLISIEGWLERWNLPIQFQKSIFFGARLFKKVFIIRMVREVILPGIFLATNWATKMRERSRDRNLNKIDTVEFLGQLCPRGKPISNHSYNERKSKPMFWPQKPCRQIL